jgi:hypothetical protein
MSRSWTFAYLKLTAMEGCLKERGHQVAGWSKGTKKPIVVQPGTASR